MPQDMVCKIFTKRKYENVDDIKEFLEEMQSYRKDISFLDLSMNAYMPVVATKLAKEIKKMKNLKKIRMMSIIDSLNAE